MAPRMGKPMPSPAMCMAGAPVLKSQVGGQHHRSHLPALLPHRPLVAARDLLRPAALLRSPQHPWEGLTWAAPVWGCGSSWSHSCATGGLPHDAGPPHPRLPLLPPHPSFQGRLRWEVYRGTVWRRWPPFLPLTHKPHLGFCRTWLLESQEHTALSNRVSGLRPSNLF